MKRAVKETELLLKGNINIKMKLSMLTLIGNIQAR